MPENRGNGSEKRNPPTLTLFGEASPLAEAPGAEFAEAGDRELASDTQTITTRLREFYELEQAKKQSLERLHARKWPRWVRAVADFFA